MDASLSSQLESIASSFSGSIVVVDSEHRIVFSRNLDRILGYQDVDVVERSVNEFIAIQTLKSLIREFENNNGSIGVDLQAADGKVVHTDVSISIKEFESAKYCVIYLLKDAKDVASGLGGNRFLIRLTTKVKFALVAVVTTLSAVLTPIAPQIVSVIERWLKEKQSVSPAPFVQTESASKPIFDRPRQELDRLYRDRLHVLADELSPSMLAVGLFWFDVSAQTLNLAYLHEFSEESVFIKLRDNQLLMLQSPQSIENLKEMDCVRLVGVAIDSKGGSVDGLMCPISNAEGDMTDSIAAFYQGDKFPLAQNDGQYDPDAALLFSAGTTMRLRLSTGLDR